MRLINIKDKETGLWNHILRLKYTLSICIMLLFIVFQEQRHNDHTMKLTGSNQINIRGSSVETSDSVPHILWFTYKHNLLKIREPLELYDNVVDTITAYRKTWGEVDVPVHFMSDEDCIPFIKRMEPRMVSYFLDEKEGAFKADICRIAALYFHGGYYSDIDMKTIEPFVLSGKRYTFATVRCKEGIGDRNIVSTCGFFQSFIASTPGHVLLRVSMEIILQVYIEDGDKSMLGVLAMHHAYEKLSEKEKDTIYLLNTYSLDDMDVGNKFHPDLKRLDGNGLCNWIVEDGENPHFFARSPMPFNSGCMASSGINNNMFFTDDMKQENLDKIKDDFVDKSFGFHYTRFRGDEPKIEDGIYDERRKYYIFDIMRLFILDHPRCMDEVDKAKPELGKFYREILDASSDLFYDICVVATLHNEGGYFHSKDLILGAEVFLPKIDTTRFIATYSSHKQTFTRGYLAASKNHAILKKTLNTLVDITEKSKVTFSDTFSVMDILYQAYMDVGGHVEFIFDICSQPAESSPFFPILLSEEGPDGQNVIKDSFGQNINYVRSNEYPGYDKCS